MKMVTGNEALARGALAAGVKVVTGYPGTPSSGVIAGLLQSRLDEARHVEWSTNEKVAFEIATGASWAGHRALCTMKMSGLNVAWDSVISVAYSGCIGGLVVYVADDPGVSSGMVEQDSRGFASLADMPVIEPSSVEEVYRLIQVAFDLSEQSGSPVLFRLVTSVANSRAAVEIEEPRPLPSREPVLEKDIARFTKAGSAICLAQHRAAIARLERAGQLIREWGLNQISRVGEEHGLGILAAGVSASYMEEALEIASVIGLHPETFSWVRILAPHPFPTEEVRFLLQHCEALLVLEELEPILERGVYIEAHRTGFKGKIFGKLEGPLERVGDYDLSHIVRGIGAALDRSIPQDSFTPKIEADRLAAQRPITVCAGCPHRGTYMAIQQAIRKSGIKKNEVVVTGDIGCTILGMNPPFEILWSEISMGASIGLAQGYVHGGVKTPVIATMGDSTFFHAGIPGLINAIHHQVPLTLIVMDNGWTSMTGMQVNPGSPEELQPPAHRRVDIARIIPALGVDAFHVVDPFDLEKTSAIIQECMTLPGVKVVLSRRECALQAQRRGIRQGVMRVRSEKCNLCQACILATGCPALTMGEETVLVDPALCYGCALCMEACHRGALEKEPIP